MEKMKEKTKKKRQLILDAALRVFVQNGYEKTKIIDIAKTAGIGKGTVYEYFDSKEGLFRCLLDEYCQLYKENVKAILKELEGASGRDKLLSMMHMEKALKEQVRLSSLDPMKLQAEFSYFPGLKQAIRDMLQYKFDVVCEILQEGIDRGEFRRINVHLATVALMGACSTTAGFMETPRERADDDVPISRMVSEEVQAEFTDESLLDLMLHGFCIS